MEFKTLTLLKKEQSILNNIECIEIINQKTLYKLLLSSNLLRMDLRYKNINMPEREHLINYLCNSITENKIKVKYIKDEYGRSNPYKSYGLYNIRREIRHTISREYYEDIDIINAHPTILEQILKHNNIKCYYLSDYINNRDKYLNIVMDKYNIKKDIAKTLFIRLLYGGSYDKWLNENNFNDKLDIIKSFNNEMWELNKIMVDNNKELYEWIKNKKENFNDSTLVAYYLQEKEVQILEELYNYSVNKGYIINNNVVLCADGMMIQKEYYNDNILKEFENLIYDKFNINLKFINKKLDQYYDDNIIDNNIDIKDINIINDELNILNNTLNDLNNTDTKLINEIIKHKSLLTKKKDKIMNNHIIDIKNIINNKKKQNLKNEKLIEKIDKNIEKMNMKNREKNEKMEFIEKEKNEKINIKDREKNIRNIIKNEKKDVIIDEKYKSNFSKSYMISLKSYLEKKKYFELFVCKILRPSCIFLYLEQNKNMCKEQCFFSEKEIISAFREYKSGIIIMGIETSFIKEWLDDSNMLCYNKSDFIPYNGLSKLNEDETIYNLFNGYNNKIKSLYNIDKKDKILQPFNDLLFSICGENEYYMDYFIKYLAHMIQKPNEKIPICFILKGKQGTGKNVLLTAISNIIGKEYYITSSKPDDFFGNYAEGFYRKLLVNMNECEGKDTFDFEGKIKSFITEDTININPKYIRPTEIRNVARIIITTNKSNPIPIDVKSIDRRFVVYQNSEKYLDKKYNSIFWDKLVNHFNCNEFIACLYDYLNSIDINNYNWRLHRPITQEYKNMCRLYIPTEALFLEYYINRLKDEKENDFITHNIQKKDDFELIQLNHMCNEYNEYCKKNGFIKNDINMINIKKFRCLIENLEAPIKVYKTMGLNKIKFNCDEIMGFLKSKNYIDIDEDDIIEDNLIEEQNIDNIDYHDDYFNFE